jgi:hypothetical protein
MFEELSWFTDYKMDLDIGNQGRIVDYINKLSNKIEEKNVESKINQIEKDYQDKLAEVEKLCKQPNQVNELKQKSSLIILQKELDIIKLLTKYTLQNKLLDYDFFVTCLNILLVLSETLRNRLGQKDFMQEKTQGSHILLNSQDNQEGIISRCSYKFCSYQDSCTYNYNLKTKNLCYQDHYVHNMVSADLKILLEYIKQKYEKTKAVAHNKEILKTINTLSFVIGHMELELRTKCLYILESEWETCHVVKNK